MSTCTHCPRPADLDVTDEDGPHPMCLGYYSALLFGIVRASRTLLAATAPVPALASAA